MAAEVAPHRKVSRATRREAACSHPPSPAASSGCPASHGWGEPVSPCICIWGLIDGASVAAAAMAVSPRRAGDRSTAVRAAVLLLAMLCATRAVAALAARTARDAQLCESDWLLSDAAGDVVGNHLDDDGDGLPPAHRLDEYPGGLLRCRRSGRDQDGDGDASHSRQDVRKLTVPPRASRAARARRRALWGDEPSGLVRPARLPRPRPPRLLASRPATPPPPPPPARSAWGGIAGRPHLPVDTDDGPAFQMAGPAARPAARPAAHPAASLPAGWSPFSLEPERHVTKTGILLPPYLPEDVIAAPVPVTASTDERSEDQPEEPAVLRNPRRIEHPAPESAAQPPPPRTTSRTASSRTGRPASPKPPKASVEEELRKAWENIAAHRVDMPAGNNNNIKIKFRVSSADSPGTSQQQQQQQKQQQQQSGAGPAEEGRMLAELLYRLARRAEELSARLEHLADKSSRRDSNARTASHTASTRTPAATRVPASKAPTKAPSTARRRPQSSSRSTGPHQSTPQSWSPSRYSERGYPGTQSPSARQPQYADHPQRGYRRAYE